MALGLAGLLGIGQAIGGVVSGIAGGKAASEQAKALEQTGELARELSADFLSNALGDVGAFRDNSLGLIEAANGLFRRTPSPETFFDTAADLEKKGFDFQTELKRENLDFITGETQDDLRTAQQQFARIATGDFSDISNTVSSRLLGIAANNRSSPTGTLFNIAARDELNFRSRGLSNTLGISDFFAREGTVDPPNPVPTSFALAEFADREDAQELQFRENQLDRSLSVEQIALGGSLQSRTSALGVAANQGLTGVGAGNVAGPGALSVGAGAVAQGFGSLSSFLMQRDALQKQSSYQEDLINAIKGSNFYIS